MQDENLNQTNNPEGKKEELFNKDLKPLRTYQGDVEKIINENHVSVTTVAVAEQKRKIERNEENTGVEYSDLKNKIFVSVGIFLFVAGIIVVGSIYFVKSKNNPANNPEIQTTLIGYTDKIDLKFASTSRTDLIQNMISGKDNYKGKLNSVLYFNFVDGNQKPTIQDVLLRITPYIPQSLSRSLDKDYMFGVYSYDKNQFFIILTTKDYGTSFAGMLKWENGMAEDLEGMFNIAKNSTSTTALFVDESLQNKDLRVLKDENNKTILLYSFINKNTIIITNNEQILTHVFDKYINSKMIR